MASVMQMRRMTRLRTVLGGIALVLPLCSPALELRSAGILTVAVYKDFAPFSQGSASGYHGVDVALARALAKRHGLALKLLPFDAGENMAADLRNMVWRGDVLHYGPADLMMHVPVDRGFRVANEQAAIFGPYYRESLVLVRDTKVLPTVRGAADLVGKFIAAEQGTAAASALLGAEGGALRDKVRIAVTPEAALHLLLSGDVAAAFVTRAQAEMALRSAANPAHYALSQLTLNGLLPGGWVVGMAVKAGNADLAAQLAAALEALRSSGELKGIFAGEGLTLVGP
ncbi:MAG: substrate-binding periplasmic protein [Steroidobacteraceae bacterium]